MNVAFVVDRFPALSETFILTQLTGLLERGHQVDVYARYAPRQPLVHPDVDAHALLARTSYFGPPASKLRRAALAAGIIAGDIRSHPAAVARAFDPRLGARNALTLWTLYAAHRFRHGPHHDYDILHCHFGPNGVIGQAVRWILGMRARLVTSFYGYDAAQLHWSRRHRPYKRLFANGDLFIGLSEDMAARLAAMGCPIDRITILPLGVNLDEIKFDDRPAAATGRTAILTIARLVEKKGLEYSIAAIARIRDRFPGIRYRIVGDGPLRPALDTLIRDLGVGDVVEITGWKGRDDIRRELEEADIFVLASVTARDGDTEGTPTVLLEAQAAGLPVIATLHGGIPEIVRDGCSGYLVPERDVDALADRLAELAGHPELWAGMGRAGRSAVERQHDSRQLAGRLEAIYGDLVGAAAAPAGGEAA